MITDTYSTQSIVYSIKQLPHGTTISSAIDVVALPLGGLFVRQSRRPYAEQWLSQARQGTLLEFRNRPRSIAIGSQLCLVHYKIVDVVDVKRGFKKCLSATCSQVRCLYTGFGTQNAGQRRECLT